MGELSDAEFWDRLRRHFTAIAMLIEKRYLAPDGDELPRSEEPRIVTSHRR